MLSSYALRQSISVAIAVLIAILVGYYFSNTREGWVMIAAFLVSQTTRGTPLKQNINSLFLIILALFSAYLMTLLTTNQDLLMLMAWTLFVMVSATVIVNHPFIRHPISLSTLFALIVFVALYMPDALDQSIRWRIVDVLMGGAIGILIGQFLFPVKPYDEFCAGVLPILQAINGYSKQYRELVIKQDNNAGMLEQDKTRIEEALQTQYGLYPEWVYEFGFNPGLRGGFRFFLVNIERLTEAYFSLDYLTDSGALHSCPTDLMAEIDHVMQKNEELIEVLITQFTEYKLVDRASDYTSDVKALEAVLQRLVPSDLSMLELIPGNIMMTSFVRDLVDARKLLLQLVLALPEKVSLPSVGE